MKYIFPLFFIAFPLSIFSYFNYENCENESIFFVQSIKNLETQVSSFYCDFGLVKTKNILKNEGVKKGTFAYYDSMTKTLSPLSKEAQIEYIRRLKTDLDNVKRDEEIKSQIFDKYTKNYRDYEDILSQFFQNYIFSKAEKARIFATIQNQPYKKFEQTVGERLLMDGEIISREEWGADESFSKKEVYMKGCENGSCYSSGPAAPNQLRDNYLAYFNAQDAKDRIVKTFDDGRDPLRYYPVDRIIIHHTASTYKATKEEGMAYMKAVQKYHALTLRWADVGYHYLIDGEGNIYEGKSGGKYVLGSHVVTHNYGSIGISLMSDGYYSDEMLESLQKLVIYLGKEYNLDLTGETTVRTNDLNGWGNGWAVVAHKELDPKKPKDPEIIMDAFREQIIEKIKLQQILSRE